MFKNEKVLVTGGTGMIGLALTKLLLEAETKVTVVSIDSPEYLPDDVRFINADLRFYDQCIDVCKGMDYVFHLAGTKGSPKMAKEKPSRFMVPMLQFNTNMLEAARYANVDWLLYTSSMGIYKEAEVFVENNPGERPSRNDWFAGWTKRMGEMQLEAYEIEGWNNWTTVRPANVYGPYDNFDLESCMVIPALIRKVSEATDSIDVFGDGSNIRDFIHARDVARGMLHLVKNELNGEWNLASGVGYTIKEIVETIIKISGKKLNVNWLGGPSGDAKRVLSMKQCEEYGFKPTISLEEGLTETYEWFQTHKTFSRYNSFKE